MILRGPLSPNMSQVGEGVTEIPIVSKGLIYISFLILEYGFGVKLYNTVVERSNFTVTVYTENLRCQFPEISVYGAQTAMEELDTNIYKNAEHFVSMFTEFKLDVANNENGQCKFLSMSDELRPYVFIKAFNILDADNVKICEVVFN